MDTQLVDHLAQAGQHPPMTQGSTRPEDSPVGAKQPLFRPLPPAPPFPLDALVGLRPAAEAIHAYTQAPVAICAQSVLAAATLAVQAHRDVELPGAGRRPLTGLFVSVAESGERKSAVDRLALRPVREVEERFRRENVGERRRYEDSKAAWDAARSSAKKAGKADRAAISRALEAIGPAPKPPPSPMLLVADPTPEALVLHLAESRPWCGVFTDEGGTLIGGAAFNDESRCAPAPC